MCTRSIAPPRVHLSLEEQRCLLLVVFSFESLVSFMLGVNNLTSHSLMANNREDGTMVSGTTQQSTLTRTQKPAWMKVQQLVELAVA